MELHSPSLADHRNDGGINSAPEPGWTDSLSEVPPSLVMRHHLGARIWADMSNQHSLDASSLRDEINALFGVRWDTLVEWSVISWLSIWFWTTMTESWVSTPLRGPLTGINEFLETLDVAPPGWYLDTVGWLTDPTRNWLTMPLIVIAVIAGVTAVRSHRLSGLRTLALVSVAVAAEIEGSIQPVAWVLLLSALPAGIAFSIGLTKQRRNTSDSYQYYFPQRIMVDFVSRIGFLFLAPILAPLLLASQLVISFRTNLPYEPAVELNAEVVSVIKKGGSESAADSDMLAALAATAAIQLAGNPSSEARRIVSDLGYELRTRRKAVEDEARLRRLREAPGLDCDQSIRPLVS